MFRTLAFITVAGGLLVACEGDRDVTAPAGAEPTRLEAVTGNQTGYVYSATNALAGNEVAVFSRASDGSLTHLGDFATGGKGNGNALGSQGSLFISDDQQWLFVANAGSNDVSVFRISGGSLALTDRVPSGGDMPNSVAFRRGLLYVLNARGAGNITAFNLDAGGRLTRLPNSTRPLSGADSTAPAQISFAQRGSMLVVTERATDLITTYQVGSDGLASGPTTHASSGIEPFGFAMTRSGALVVSEGFDIAPGAAAVSSYQLGTMGVALVSGSVKNGQTASCWVALTRDQQFTFISNSGTGNVSSYRVGADGSLTLLQGAAASTGPGSLPIDNAVTGNGYFYALNQASGEIDVFRVGSDGSLTAQGGLDALPAFAAGLAQR